MTALSTEPGTNHDPAVLAAKLDRLEEPHIRGLTAFVDEIREQTGRGVPYVDPDSGGTGSTVIVLLRSPGKAASARTGLLSVDNDSPTARHLWQAHEESGLRRDRAFHWNAVPWFAATEDEGPADALDTNYYLQQLIALVPGLRVVIGVGPKPSLALAEIAPTLAAGSIHTLHVAVPGPHASAADLAQLAAVFTAARVLSE
ncbi:MAG: hypothetical protein JWO46_2736 [Nocardioidaceae bacterium]|nr:hypothetical protein [Nocardioidaceae bacterium]